MRFGRLVESFDFLPTINLGWYVWKGKRHFYWGVSWLFWYATTLDEFEWEKDELPICKNLG